MNVKTLAQKAHQLKKKFQNSFIGDQDKNFAAIFEYNKLLLSSNIDPYYKEKKEAHFKATGGVKLRNVFQRLTKANQVNLL